MSIIKDILIIMNQLDIDELSYKLKESQKVIEQK
jgi:hypothetical protein